MAARCNSDLLPEISDALCNGCKPTGSRIVNISCFLLFKMNDVILTPQMARSSRVSFLNAAAPRVLIYYYLNCQCHCLYQPQVYPRCKSMCKFLCANLNSAMFSNSVFGRLHPWAYLITNNLEVVSQCNSGCSIIMAKYVYSVNLGLLPL